MTDLVTFRDASVRYGSRVLWSDLSLGIEPGEFVALLGPNGTGKTSLLSVLTGQTTLSSGSFSIAPETRLSYVPQSRGSVFTAPIRGRDLVGLGLDGNRYGLSFTGRAERRKRIDTVLDEVGAMHYANVPVAGLSGGEQQRLRIAQALVSDPSLLLCDEPLTSLDVGHQHGIIEVLRSRMERGMGVLFVSHELNPILSVVDRVVYIVGGRFRIGPVDEVVRSEVLSELYGMPIEVLRRGSSIAILGAENAHHEATMGGHCQTEPVRQR